MHGSWTILVWSHRWVLIDQTDKSVWRETNGLISHYQFSLRHTDRSNFDVSIVSHRWTPQINQKICFEDLGKNIKYFPWLWVTLKICSCTRETLHKIFTFDHKCYLEIITVKSDHKNVTHTKRTLFDYLADEEKHLETARSHDHLWAYHHLQRSWPAAFWRSGRGCCLPCTSWAQVELHRMRLSCSRHLQGQPIN